MNTVVIAGGGVFIGAPGGVGGDELQAISESDRSGNGWRVLGASDVDNDDLVAFAYCLELGT